MMLANKISLMGLVCTMLVGCNTNYVSPTTPYWNAYIEDTSKFIKVVNLIESRAPGDEKVVSITLMASGLQRVKGAYKITWFNASGAPINTILSRQQEISMAPKETANLKFIAPNTQATSFKVVIKD